MPPHVLLLHYLPWIPPLDPIRRYEGSGAESSSTGPTSPFLLPIPRNKETEQPWQKSHRQNLPACRLLRTVRLKGDLTRHLPQCLLSRGVWHQRSPEKEDSCLGTMPMFKSVHCHETQYSGAEARMENELVCVCVCSQSTENCRNPLCSFGEIL